MDKKGAIGLAFTQVIWIPRLIFLAVAILACMLLIMMYLNVSYASEAAERDTIIQRIMFSPNGISYFNPLEGRMEPGTIDLRKFKTEILDKAITYEHSYMAAQIYLEDMDNQNKQTIYYNEEGYRRWSVLRGLKGKGGVDYTERNFYVLIKDGEAIHKGKLSFTVFMPRR